MKRLAVVGMALGLTLTAACGGGSGPQPEEAEPLVVRDVNATGASSMIEADDRQFAETVQEMLRGKVSGLQVLEVPGCGVTLRIRGMTDSLMGADPSCEKEPLLIIDDKPIAPGHIDNALKGLIPLHIERVRVLKDIASTAMYGSRGANGVVIITTRR